MRDLDISRRRMLAGLGATGVGSLVGLGVATRGAVTYTDTMVVTAQSEFTLEADWRETYNGQVLEDTTAGETPDGPVISLGGIMPGDRGTFSFRLSVEEEDIAVLPELSLDLTETAENGVNDPEREAGDDPSSDQGELQNHLDVAVWYDEGALGVDGLGGDNATQDFGENLITDDDGAEGTLAEVAENVDGVPLDANDCIDSESTVTVTFGWSFDADGSGGNITQTDSVTFDFNITADVCE